MLTFSLEHYAQTNIVDSLVRYISTLEEDTNKVNALNELAYVHRTNKVDTSILLVLQSEKLATALKYDKGIARAIAVKGIVYSGLGDYSRALQFVLESSEIYEKINDKKGVASNTNIIGVIHGHNKNYDKSIAYYDKARRLYIELKDLKGQRKALNNIGFIYKLRAEYTQSLDYLRRAIEIAEMTNDTCKILYPVYNIGGVYLKLNQLDSAKDYLTRSLNYARKCKDGYVVSLALIDLGHMHVANNNLKLAIDSYQEAYDVSESIGLRQEISESAKALSNLFEQQHDPYKALAYFKIFQRTNDSLFNEENTRRMTLLEAEYNFEKEIREAKLKRQVIEFEQARILSRAIWIRNSFIAAFILMLITSYLFYKNFRRKRVANKMLKSLNIEIHDQKEELIVQAEGLRRANEEISTINNNLEATVEERTLKLREQSTKLIKYVFYNSHKVRAPLARILGLVTLLRSNAIAEDEIPKILSIIDDEANTLDNMVKEMTKTLEAESKSGV